MSSESCDPLNFPARVWFRVERGFVRTVGWIGFRAVAEVDSACEFADDSEVDARADVFSQGRAGCENGTGEEAGSQVAECLEGFAEFQETYVNRLVIWFRMPRPCLGTVEMGAYLVQVVRDQYHISDHRLLREEWHERSVQR